MSIPGGALLGFALWTLLTLLGSVGVYRWSLILTGRAAIADFPADNPTGSALYLRAMRAHANCVENLPVFGAIVLAIAIQGTAHPALDVLPIVFLAARIGQTVVHIGLPQTNRIVSLRFVLFFTQIICMFAMAGIVVLESRRH